MSMRAWWKSGSRQASVRPESGVSSELERHSRMRVRAGVVAGACLALSLSAIMMGGEGLLAGENRSLILSPPNLSGAQTPGGIISTEPLNLELKRFEPSRIQKDVNYLASPELQGRGLGTPELDKAAEYIAARFKDAGLAGGMPDGSYFMPFEIQTDVTLGATNALEVLGAGGTPVVGLPALVVSQNFTPLGFTDSASLESGVVFAGYGISAPELGYDDFKDQDVKDKVVVVLRGLPSGSASGPFSASGAERFGQLRYKAMAAREKGAKAILFVDREAGGSLMNLPKGQVVSSAGIVSVQLGRVEAEALLKAGGVDLGAVQKAIDSSFKPASQALSGVQLKAQISVEKKQGHARNVVAFLPGTDPVLKDEVIVIGAHYDHLGLGGESSLAPEKHGTPHVGADDNASGTSGVLELARYFARDSHLKRSVMFVTFSAEESGLGGSAFYTRSPARPLDKTVLMVNMDMIGRLRDKKLSIQGVDTAKGLRELLTPLAAGLDFKASFTGDGYGPSDHTPFYAKDIPVLFFFTGSHADYHRPSDTPDKINSDGIAQVLELVSRTVETIGAQAARPAYVRLSSAPPPMEGGGGGNRGYGAYLGTIPDFTEAEGGVLLSGVRAGSPAEQAGLKGGDMIVQMDGKKVLNLQDFTLVLREHKPGDVVEITFKRDGKEQTVKATLGKR